MREPTATEAGPGMTEQIVVPKKRASSIAPPPTESSNSGGPSVLIGYGNAAERRLRACADLGALVKLAAPLSEGKAT